jgi:hypothetical protein
MQDVNFVYNTSLDELIMPEYGRMVQDLVLHCKAIEDPKYRQSFAETVIELMQIMTHITGILKNIEKNYGIIFSA